jgi:hypothetical protein
LEVDVMFYGKIISPRGSKLYGKVIEGNTVKMVGAVARIGGAFGGGSGTGISGEKAGAEIVAATPKRLSLFSLKGT